MYLLTEDMQICVPEDVESKIFNGILIAWNINLDVWGTKELKETLYNRCPRKYFTGNIIVGDAVLGRGMQIKAQVFYGNS